MEWSGNVWLAIIAAFVVGAILGYVFLLATKGDVKKHYRLEAELKEANTKIDTQKQQLEQHFEQTATLLAGIAEDYKRLYSHLAKSAEQFLPEAEKIEFFQQPKIEQKTEENPPKDYSEGSSGLLK